MITKFGKRFLTNYLAGNVSFSEKELALGIGNTAANVDGNDTRLQFEFYRVPVKFSSIDISEVGGAFVYKAVFVATIPQDVSGVISEIGLYPSSRTSINNFDSKFISSFENNILWEDSVGSNPSIQLNTTTFLSKIGENMVLFQSPSSTAKEYKSATGTINLSGYSNTSTHATYSLNSIKNGTMPPMGNIPDSLIQKLNPDVITGYNINGFDFEYIQEVLVQ
jgi:hypothetical protein